ncbi:aminotransferase class V-fold PLP-dependent enzyme [Paraburkholderia rhynchosiae]|uniref:Aminotransferase n=1 Tax=Paraburkholderia rhynchosiae TaxID=487049 RepID=A0A2N7VKA0_9BURK|nr:aminotransferase class V-fold PLP-dependent enzyme [Paraburkholderia rhynchosiae]PMS17576.1 aminotransferase [Paraburkholderia rhynchosiae]CAB3744505.1 putative cysteine desulfurase [Paraburkholderia rhynchosiae]
MQSETGQHFDEALMTEVKSKFLYVDEDLHGKSRLYFDNAGGSFRLKAAIEAFTQIDAIPDNPERIHELAVLLQEVQRRGTEDARAIFNAGDGSIFASLSASGAMFDMVRAIAENVDGSNMVTTVLEHPSSFDAVTLYAQRLGKELRVAKSNRKTGAIDVEAIVELVDANTCVVSVMYASNITGAKIDLPELVKQIRRVKPDVYMVVDAVQHAPHGVIDVQAAPVDCINFAPYKFFGCRGSGISWLSPRASLLPHHKLAGKKADFWDLGTSAPAQFAVITKIVDYVCWLGKQQPTETDRRSLFAQGMRRIELHERALLNRMLNGSPRIPGLRSIRGVNVLLDHDDLTTRDLIVAMSFDNIEESKAVREYERRGVIVYERVASSLYSKRMLDSFGITGAVRVSPLHCNSAADIDRFLQVTSEIARERG